MNFFKRAFLYCWRQKIHSLILLLLFSILSATVIICISSGKAAKQGTTEVKETVGGSIHIEIEESQENYGEGVQNENGITYQYNGDYITDEVIEAISKVDGVVNYNAKISQGYWGAAVGFEFIPGAFNIDTTGGHGPSIPMPAVFNSSLDSNFLDGTYTLEEGRHIQPEDSYVTLISKELADKNGLSVGDEITFWNREAHNGNEDTFTIIGIFSGTEGTGENAMMAAYVPANQCYIDLNAYNDIFEHGTNGSALDVFVRSAENTEDILEEIKNLPEVKGKTFLFQVNNEDFEMVSTPLSSLDSMVNTAVLAVSIIGTALIVLLLLLWTRSRKREIGILLAIGRSKGEIIAQFLTENLLIALVAMAVSSGLTLALVDKIGSFLISQSGENVAELAITAAASDMTLVFGIGLLLVCAAVIIASLTVLRLKPRDILAKMS